MRFWQITRHQVQFVNLHVAEAATAKGFAHRSNEVCGTFQRHDFAGGSDNFSQIKRGITGASAEIENTLADGDARSLPTIQHHRTPDSVLQPKPDQLFVVCSENIILLAHAR